MKLCCFCFIYITLSFAKVKAQNEYENWYIGVYVGMNFCNGLQISNAYPLTSDDEASATISNKNTGHMLFHTDGETVWNSQYQVMSNGNGLKGSATSTQGALIVPLPDNDSIYYIFTMSAISENQQDGLEYSIVNINEQAGLGEVLSKNNYLYASDDEKLTAVYSHLNNCYWILTVDANNFIEYRLDQTGLSAIPIIYPTGVDYSVYFHDLGYLKGSPDGKFLSGAFESIPKEILYKFNDTTGVITYLCELQLEKNDYAVFGTSFSSNSTKLYVGSYDDNSFISKIYQYDITSGYPTTINNSRANLYSYNYTNNDEFFGSFQLGPDKKLYIARVGIDSICEIASPDSSGISCGFIFNALFTDSLYSFYSLSNNIDNLYEWAQPPSLSVAMDSSNCKGNGYFTITAWKNFNDYEISFGDGADTILDSLQFSFEHHYPSAGSYTITIRGRLGCVYDSISQVITITQPCVEPLPALIIPTLIYGRGSQTQWHILNLPQGNNKVTLYDELGRVIYATNNYPNNYDMRNLPSAVYFYRLTLENGQVYVGKIVVVK